MSTTVTLQQTGGIARVQFHSENGIQLLGAAVRAELKRVITSLEHDPGCRVVIFEATGRTFLAGADINELASLTAETARKFARSGQRLFKRIADLPAVTIAAIHGACAGGGCELSLACDYRIAGEAARIGLPEVTLGLIPGWGGSARTQVMLGPAIARRIVLSGELFTAAEACRLGLVHECVPDDQLRTVIDARAAQILKTGPAAIDIVKQMLDAGQSELLDDLLRLEARAFAACYETGEPEEGVGAFLAKRAAQWRTA